MSERLLQELSTDDSKDIIIAKLLNDLKITEGWIRRHIAGDRSSSHSALSIVADDLKNIDYPSSWVVDRYKALEDTAFSLRLCLMEFKGTGTIHKELIEDAENLISKVSSVGI